LFVLVSFSGYVSLRVLDKAEYSAFESTLNSSIVSYHLFSVYWNTRCELTKQQRRKLIIGVRSSTKFVWCGCGSRIIGHLLTNLLTALYYVNRRENR